MGEEQPAEDSELVVQEGGGNKQAVGPNKNTRAQKTTRGGRRKVGKREKVDWAPTVVGERWYSLPASPAADPTWLLCASTPAWPHSTNYLFFFFGLRPCFIHF